MHAAELMPACSWLGAAAVVLDAGLQNGIGRASEQQATPISVARAHLHLVPRTI